MAENIGSASLRNVSDSSKHLSDVQSCQDTKTDKVMEPLLLEDFQKSRSPTSLLNLMNLFDKQCIIPNKCDFLVGCIYILMLEYGFIPQEKENSCEDCGFSMSQVKELSSFPAWKKLDDNSYCLSLILPPHQLFVCKILCFKMGDDMIINAIVKNIQDVNYTLMLDVLSYFTDGWATTASMLRVQNLRQLSTLFKNNVAFPIKHAILSLTQTRHPCLEDLPPEIIFHIFKYIHGNDRKSFTATCKKMYSLRQNEKSRKKVLRYDLISKTLTQRLH